MGDALATAVATGFVVGVYALVDHVIKGGGWPASFLDGGIMALGLLVFNRVAARLRRRGKHARPRPDSETVFHDPLTGLPNAAKFETFLDGFARQPGSSLGLLVVRVEDGATDAS